MFNKLMQHSFHSREDVEAQLHYTLLVDRSNSERLFTSHSPNNLPVKNCKGHFGHELRLRVSPRLTIVERLKLLV